MPKHIIAHLKWKCYYFRTWAYYNFFFFKNTIYHLNRCKSEMMSWLFAVKVYRTKNKWKWCSRFVVYWKIWIVLGLQLNTKLLGWNFFQLNAPVYYHGAFPLSIKFNALRALKAPLSSKCQVVTVRTVDGFIAASAFIFIVVMKVKNI